MPNELFRRHFLKAGVGFIGAAAGSKNITPKGTVTNTEICHRKNSKSSISSLTTRPEIY